jgi:hypothetical protein
MPELSTSHLICSLLWVVIFFVVFINPTSNTTYKVLGYVYLALYGVCWGYLLTEKKKVSTLSDKDTVKAADILKSIKI